jgi:AcrR family transcriptional regulator
VIATAVGLAPSAIYRYYGDISALYESHIHGHLYGNARDSLIRLLGDR